MQVFPYVLLGLGTVLVGTSLVGWLGRDKLFQVQEKIIESLRNENQQWWHPSGNSNSSQYKTDSFLKVYFFNVTNTNEVIEGKKPNLNEVGPYVFQGEITRNVELIDQNKDILSYNDNEQYYFRPDLTYGEEEDVLTIINFPYVGLAQEVSKLSSFSRIIVMGVISRYHEGLFLTKTAKQLLFGGYKHELLATLSAITGEQYMKDNTFGFFYERNNTNKGSFEVSLGQRDPSNFGKILTWNKTSKVNYWKSDECNKFGGSYEGTLFPSGKSITKDSILTLFYPSMCRKLRFGFKEEVDYYGLTGYRFVMLREELVDPKKRKENMCYCISPGRNNEDCPKDGSYQLNACAKDASVSMSLPHFLYGSEDYLDSAVGYLPDADKHLPYIDIEPVSGTMLKMSKRSQVNLEIRPLRIFSEFRKLHKMLFPAIWVEETREVPFETVNALTLPSKVLIILIAIGLGVGMLLILLSFGIIIARLRRNRTKYNT